MKYLLFVMRADNVGEGGILALVALVRGRRDRRPRGALIALGLFGAALLYGDGMITPAISVLSAVEGLSIATHAFEPFVVTVTCVILIVLFLVQHRGTSGLGSVFGPIMIVWFAVIAVLGVPAIARTPVVLAAVNPAYAYRFCASHGWATFLTLGAVVLAITGAEALYADMGHFGRAPIRVAWFAFVLPSLLVNYFGQGALLLVQPDAYANPFYHLAPSWALYPLVVLATVATVIASQAIISGAFSLTQQAVQLGYLPRFDIRHTSVQERGQIYVPEVNTLLLLATLGLVVGFRSSTNLAAAYGMAVSATMAITTVLAYVVAREEWRWSLARAVGVASGFLAVDLAFLVANLLKIVHGGWFPLAVAAGIFLIMTTWHTGRKLVTARLNAAEVPLDRFFEELRARPPLRVPGTAVFMTAHAEGVPPILVHHLRHNKVLHEQVVLLTVVILETPTLGSAAEIDVRRLEAGVFRVIARYGYLERLDVPRSLAAARVHGLDWHEDDTTFYLAQLTLFATDRIGMALWRDRLFIFLSRNARRATNFFHLPPNRVVEIGIQLEL
jgi:KUP system potassium uptake protein